MADPLTAAFGQIVRRRREALGLSQEEVGEKTNLSRNYIGMVERGETNPTLLVVRSLASALNTTMASLIADLEAEPTLRAAPLPPHPAPPADPSRKKGRRPPRRS